MTAGEVQELVHSQAEGHFIDVNNHGISLGQVLVAPQEIIVIVRSVRDGLVTEAEQRVWLVGKEGQANGYSIVMREDGRQFGLASEGFPTDRHLCLDGLYGGLVSAFMSM